MCFSNARAVAGLWQRFVRYLREGCWDQGRLLPRMGPYPPSSQPRTAPNPSSSSQASLLKHHGQSAANEETAVEAAGTEQLGSDSQLPRPDFSCCLLHQKLQMLNLCIQQAYGLQARQSAQEQPSQVGLSGRLAYIFYCCTV